MNYRQCLKRLFETGRARIPKNDLVNMQRLLPHLDHPEKKSQFIHIAGSNGKGTAAFQIAESLHLAGHKVGLFTSPHISSFRERIRIGTSLITEEQVATQLTRIFTTIDQHNLEATFFEIVTCCAFLFFADQNVNVVILETGLGGRADATNVVHPLISVITSISLEHTEILGDTVEEIAFEKAGIIKPQTPVVIGKSVPRSVIDPIAKKLNSRVIYCPDDIARCALENLHWPYDSAGLSMRPSCRFEEFGHYILDIAHNPDSCRRLISIIQDKYPKRKIHCLFSFSKQQSLTSVLQTLGPHVEQFVMLDFHHERILPAKTVHDQASKLGFVSSCSKKVDLKVDSDDLVLVCGSFYMMNEVRNQLGLNDVRDSL